MTSITVRAFAKINLYLKILSKRPDGFHDIETIMQNISLFDELTIENGENGIIVDCDDPAVPSGDGNICYKAAKRLIGLSGAGGVKIKIKKNIPSGAGLGGGSSDAAAVIMALNKLWGLSLDSNAMIKIAGEIGSDVPFFIIGGRALCRGRGEVIEKLPDPPKSYYVLVKPDVSVDTKWAYGEWDKKFQISNFKLQKGEEKRFKCVGSNIVGFENDFEKIILPEYPAIDKVKKDLVAAGCGSVFLTGSGSAVFGKANNETGAKAVFETISNKYPGSFLTSSVNSAVEYI
ncbi:MAG: 4-(cytidine 5'-diphospho)-2-C-methyl-D-erythritol kinase [Candidatus Margulisiibacteriota bacterium]